MEIVSNPPTVAANKPVCVLKLMRAVTSMVNMRAHKNQDTICISLTAFGYLSVVLLCNFAVYGVERP